MTAPTLDVATEPSAPPAALLTVVVVAVVVGAATVALDPLVALGLVVLATAGLLAIATLQRFDVVALAMLAGRAALDLTHVRGAPVLRPSVVVTLGFTLVACLWLAAQAREGRFRLSPVAWASIGLAATAVLSVVFSSERATAAEGVVRFGTIAVMFATFEHLARDRRLAPRMVWAVLAGSVVPLVVGAMQLAGGDDRIEGTLSHPNTFGFFLTVMLVVAFAAAPRVQGWLRVPFGLFVAFVAVELVLTYSRSSYLAVVVAAVAMVVASRRWWLLPVLAVLVAGTLAVPGVQTRLADLTETRNASGTAGNSLVWRLDYWQQLGELAEDAPATGIGSMVIEDVTAKGKPAHNDVVKAYVETGLLGLAAYLWLGVALFATALRAVRRARDRWQRSLAVGAVGVVSAFAVASLGSNIIQQLVSQWYFMAFMAVVSADAWAPGPRDLGQADGSSVPARSRT